MSRLTISVVSGSSQANLRRCLETLAPAAEPFDCRLIVTDNLSGWDVAGTVREYFPGAEIISNDARRGFGKNHNRALVGRKDDFALVINDDIEFRPDTLVKLLELAASKPDGALFGPVIHPSAWEAPWIPPGGRLGERMPKPLSAAAAVMITALFGQGTVKAFLRKRNAGRERKDEMLSYICGTCCLVRRSFIESHGLYDEDYHMYFEDIDLGRKARTAGFECWQAAGAEIMHLEGATSGPRTSGWLSESAVIYAKKHHGPATLAALRISLAASGTLMKLKNIFSGAK